MLDAFFFLNPESRYSDEAWRCHQVTRLHAFGCHNNGPYISLGARDSELLHFRQVSHSRTWSWCPLQVPLSPYVRSCSTVPSSRFLSRTTPLTCLGSLRPAVDIEPCLVYGDCMLQAGFVNWSCANCTWNTLQAVSTSLEWIYGDLFFT